ncbi:MAG TPA: ABC transporter permease, partial [Gammaproteobacteria bacterium]|nr:ABC transporter permease [Gammaproteobacteria bacterium]
NAMLRSVFERVHEFGIMKALGVTPTQCVVLIYAETILQTLFASVVGLLFGMWAASHFETQGLDMSNVAGEASFAGIALDPIWYAHISPDTLLNPTIFLFVIAILAVIYPAIKVAKIRAVDAIHYHY